MMQKVKLKYLASWTEFYLDGKRFRLTTSQQGDDLFCEPYLGGKFQSENQLLKRINSDQIVECK